MVDYGALLRYLAERTLIFLGIYVTILLLLRVSKFFRLESCPNCGNELKRQKRTSSEKLVSSLSFGILPVKRYRCHICYWEGQSFEIKRKRKKSEAE